MKDKTPGVGAKRKAGGGDVGDLERRRRQVRSTGREALLQFVDAVDAATDGASSLRVRMAHAVKLRQIARKIDRRRAVELVQRKMEVVGKLASALQHTAYFPLQEMYFVSLTRLLREISNDPEVKDEILQRFEKHIQGSCPGLLTSLPLKCIIASEDAEHARRELNAMNHRLHTCRTFNLLACSLSPTSKESLEPVDAGQWIDFGDTTASLYHRVDNATEVLNIPYTSIRQAVIDEQQATVLLYSTKKTSKTSSTITTFIKLSIAPGDFALIVTILSAIARDASITYNTLVKDWVSPTVSAPRTPISSKSPCHVVSPSVTRKLLTSYTSHHKEAGQHDTIRLASPQALCEAQPPPCKECDRQCMVVTPAKNDEARGSSPLHPSSNQGHESPVNATPKEASSDCHAKDQLTFERLGHMLDRRLEEVRENIIGDVALSPPKARAVSGISDLAGKDLAPSVQSTLDSSPERTFPIGKTQACESDASNLGPESRSAATPWRPHHVAVLAFVGLLHVGLMVSRTAHDM